MNRIIFASFTCCIALTGIRGQEEGTMPADLIYHADVMSNAAIAAHRLRAAELFRSGLTESLSQPNGHELTFESLPWLQVVTPTDSSFRIITWGVEGEDRFTYYGLIQFLDDGDRQLLIPLTESRSLRSQYAYFTHEEWYGALYYGILPFLTADQRQAYLLLGFDANDRGTNKRVADVLTFDSTTAIFGLPVFLPDPAKNDDVRSRIITEYHDGAVGMMRFDPELQLLIYDHIILINSVEGPIFVPDGSFHGYRYADGQWHFIDKVFNVIVDEPPGGRPPDPVKRDLFGRERGQ